MDEHGHIALFLSWVKREYVWLSTAAIGLFYAARWSWVKMMAGQYMERSEIAQTLQKCEKRFEETLADHEEREFRRQDNIEQRIKDQHKELSEKIDGLMKIIIDKL